ncbi:MAG: hypothetical protein LBN40_00680 [Oscillospiraceae bacterium]|jgi:hypothetical protein|nr:hypothetical protein [Oscillospiraceae bacterium]
MKKALAMFTALAVTLSLMALSSCKAEPTYALTIDGEEIPTGFYVSMQLSALEVARDIMKTSYGLDTTVQGFRYRDQFIGSQTYFGFVQDRAVDMTKQMVAIEKLFTENVGDLTADERSDITQDAATAWNEEATLSANGKNFTTWKSYYEYAGISENSFRRVYTDSKKKILLFNKLYGEGGKYEVDEAILMNEFELTYGRYRSIDISLLDNENTIVGEEEQAVRKAKLAEFKKRLEAGEPFSAVIKDVDKYNAELNGGTYEEPDPDEETEGGRAATNDDDPESINDSFVSSENKETSSFTNVVFDAEYDKLYDYEDDSRIVVFKRYDITELTDIFDTIKPQLLTDLMSDEFEALIAAKVDTLTAVLNEKALAKLDNNRLD